MKTWEIKVSPPYATRYLVLWSVYDFQAPGLGKPRTYILESYAASLRLKGDRFGRNSAAHGLVVRRSL